MCLVKPSGCDYAGQLPAAWFRLWMFSFLAYVGFVAFIAIAYDLVMDWLNTQAF